LLTEQSGCGNCHLQINPPGFAFESFDAIGRARSEEDGTKVDTSGSITLDGAVVSFDGATALVGALAASQEAHACYVRRWLAFTYGHDLTPADEPVVESLSATPLPVKELLARITSSTPMRQRTPNEVSP
jgi:hypothetical protein